MEIPSDPPEFPELADAMSNVCSDPPTPPSVIVLVLPNSCMNLLPIMCVCDMSNVKSKIRPGIDYYRKISLFFFSKEYNFS